MSNLDTILELYNLSLADSKSQDGYDTKIHKITSQKGNNYTLKIYPFSEDNWTDLEAENQILLALKSKLNYDLPFPIENRENQLLTKLDGKIIRLLHYVEGTFWGDQKTNELFLTSLGTEMANIDIQLSQINPGAIKYRNLQWDLNHLLENVDLLKYVLDPVDKKFILYFFDQFETFTLPKLKKLPRQLIHNDFNPWNVLTDESKISGLIDFGDMVYSARINELAVCLSYVLSESEDITKDLRTVLHSYHTIYPLLTEELDLLYHLIAGRIITSLVNSAEGKVKNPDNEYIQISEKPYRQLLHTWISTNPLAIKHAAYEACGFSIPDNSDKKKEITNLREKHFTTALSLSYNSPIHMSNAAFQYMHDTDGNTYLDAYNNIPLVGHNHPRISKAVSTQIRTLNTNTRYHYEQLTQYASRLLKHFPDKLSKVYFVNSGSAASDLAIRLAKTHTNRKNIFVLEDGYHGNTQIGIDISPYKHNKKGGKGKPDHIHHFPLPKIFNNPLHADQIIQAAILQIDELLQQQKHPAAFIAEPISGCGGQVPLPPNYLASLFPKIRAAGGCCIVDEVQTGFGRLGNWFWGFEMQGVIPDIVILGKPMGNGHPLAAVVCTEEIAYSFNNGMEFFSSFGGNPVSCIIGNEVLKIVEEENLQKHAKEVGAYWKVELTKLQKDYPILADIRGEGLFLGVEIMEDGKPATKLASDIKNKMKEQFILVSTDGKYDNVLKMKPPLCFGKGDVDRFCERLGMVLGLLATN